MRMRLVARAMCACALTVFAVPAWAQVDGAAAADAHAGHGHADCDHVFTDEELFPPEEQGQPFECVIREPLAGRGLYVNRLWPNRTVRYQFAPDVSILNQQRTLAAMAEIEAVCQVRFVPRNEEPDYVRIQNGSGNNATLGYTGRQQTLNMLNWSSRFVIVHELMHTLGFHHEQKRADRDQFVQVNFQNIQPGFHDQFTIEFGAFTHGSYDYLSVMHYSTFAFSNGLGPSITTLNPAFQNEIGNRNELSAGDRATLAFLYGAPVLAVNNDCANALAIAGDGIFIFDNGSATEDGLAGGGCPAFSDGMDNDVWFRWTADQLGQVSVSTCGQTDVNTRLAVYRGANCPAGTALLACSDDSCGFGFEQAQVTFAATPGQEYLIRLGTPQGLAGGVGTFTISTQTGGGAPNDNCLTAPAIMGFGTFAFDTSAATTDGAGSEECNFFAQPNMEQDIWFKWTSPITGEVTASTCGGETTFDSKIAVLTGSSCTDPVLVCADDSCESLQAEVRFAAVSGRVYLIRIGSHPGDPGGPGTLTIDDRPPPPANDNCFAAINVSLGDTPFTNISASTDGPLGSPLCTPRADVWFAFRPAVTGEYRASTCGADFNTVLTVYDGAACPAFGLAQLGCNDDACGTASEVTFSAVGGTTYLIRVGGSELAQGSGVLRLTGPPANDNCTGATVAMVGDTPFSTVLASDSTPAVNAPCAMGSDVWFRHVASASGTTTVSTCGANFDTVVAVYASCPAGTMQPIACNNDSCGTGSRVQFSATAGTTYRIRIGGVGGAEGSGTLTIQPPAACPCNLDGVPGVDVFDLLAYLDLWFALAPAAEFDGVPGINVFDLLAFLDCWFPGC